MSYLDLSDRRVEFTAVLDPRERRKSIVGRRVAAAKEKKRGRKEKKGGGNITYSGEKEEGGKMRKFEGVWQIPLWNRYGRILNYFKSVAFHAEIVETFSFCNVSFQVWE